MKNAIDFIRFALSHCKAESIPIGAELPLALEECGVEPWEYLFGTTGQIVTQSLLDQRFNSYYSKKGWTASSYQLATENWVSRKVRVCDCQGLLDVYLGTDVNANYCYISWCTEKGKISEVDRGYKLGEAVFMQSKSTAKMTHVGWICGFLAGEPLVVEARGLRYGVVVTKLSERPWTHRGLMTKIFSYESENSDMNMPIIVKKTSPMMQGDEIKQLQKALNALGYRDEQGLKLNEDGKCGAKTMQAVKSFSNAHADAVQPVEMAKPLAVFSSVDGAHNMVVLPSEEATS